MKHAVKGKKPHVNSVTIFALVLEIVENGDRNGNGESNTSANIVTEFTCGFLPLTACFIYDK